MHHRPPLRATASALALSISVCAAPARPASPPTVAAPPEDTPLVRSVPTVSLAVEITRWTDDRLEFRYETVNDTPVGIVLFDEAPTDTYGGFALGGAVEVLEEHGRVVLFRGAVFRDRCLHPLLPISVGGRPLGPGESASAVVSIALPLFSPCGGTPGDPTADTLDICVGHVEADDPGLRRALEGGRATTGKGGRYQVGLLPTQRRSCVSVTR